MKLSFSLPSEINPKPNPRKPLKNFGDDNKNSNNAEVSKKYVASESITNSGKQKDVVISPIQNEWWPQTTMKYLELPIVQSDGSSGLHFEVESPSLAAAKGNDSKISYGLNLRKTTKWNETEGDDQANCSKSKPPGTEVTRSAPGKEVLLQKLKSDLRRLPDDQGMEEFADGPVEAFAVALLAGYGWYLGRGIGKNAKEDVKVLERQKWTRRHGIGFVSDDVPNHDANTILKSDNKGKEKEKKKKKERGREADRDNEGGTVFGKKVRIVRGRDAEGEDSRRGSQSSMGQISWLTSHIRVRIISKDLKGGRLYLKKGVVVDVVTPRTCDLSMDESNDLIRGVSQDLLETTLPRLGGPVLVLFGKHKGVFGSLVERDLDREIVVVQDADTHALLNVRLEQIAEYIGDPSYLGY